MGPRFCKRGNYNPEVRLIELEIRLQWGHAFVSVETAGMLTHNSAHVKLQWGHAFVSVETAGDFADYPLQLVLQWGHAFVSVETGVLPTVNCTN